MSIKVLPPEIVARIAAGEVVERPASVVKELVENAIDAESTEISVEIEGAGTSLIRVSDNGIGIMSNEMGLLLGRHATSKIANIDDLENITTLGFRGEALPSIASVAELEIVSHAKDEAAGHFMSVNGGAVTEGSRGRSPGTTISVRNLFRRVPARLKFLKSTATETSKIANVVSQYALAYPEIKFTLTVNGRVSLRTPGSGKLEDAAAQVFGNEIAKDMLPIRENADNTSSILVTGVIGSPAVSRNTADYISFFVNRRWIVSRLLVRAVEEAYHGLIMVGRHPAAVVNIFIPPSDIDVNIHPSKTEIKFRNEHAVFGAVEKAVRQSLMAETAVPGFDREISPHVAGVAEAIASSNPARPAFNPYARPYPARPAAAFTRNDSPDEEPAPRLANMLPVLRVVGQVMSNYILAEGPDGLYIIDQHAAHERILFEKLNREGSVGEALEVQGLLEPYALAVGPRETAIIKSQLDYLKTLGFTLEPFGQNTYLVRAVPAVVAGAEWKAALTEILDTMSSGERTTWRENIAASLACHSAVRSGKVLSEKEMEGLIRALEQTTVPMSCPHGRPTVIRISKAQLEKDFGRS